MNEAMARMFQMDYSQIEARVVSYMSEERMRATENDARVREMARRIDNHITDALLYGLTTRGR